MIEWHTSTHLQSTRRLNRDLLSALAQPRGLARLISFASLVCSVAVPDTAHGVQVPGGADSVKVRAVAPPSSALTGNRVSIAVVLEHARGFHTWPNKPVIPPEFEGVMPIATTIELVSLPEALVLNEIRWPEPRPVTVHYTQQPVELLSYADTVTAHVVLRLPQGAPLGKTPVNLRVRYQSCDERICYPPKTVDLTVRLTPPPR